MILIIDNYDSFTYNLYQLVAVLAAPEEVVVVQNDEISLQQIRDLRPTSLIISPGPSRPETAGISIEATQAFADSLPILGVCLGMQAIAVAFGGRVVRAAYPVHGKASSIFHCGESLFVDVPAPMEAGRYHSLIVERETLPSKLKIEAETSDGLVMAIRHVRYPCFGVQFHPESLLTPCGGVLMRNFLKLKR